ncbi:MAG: NfeD family protein [Bacteroidota bacterium]
MKTYLQVLGILLLSLIINISFTQNLSKDLDKKLVYVFNIKTEIGPAIWRQTQKAFKEAQELKADAIIIHMNTYGGLVDDADSIRTKILNADIPVYVFIDNNAASAGALISIACDKIFMRKGANIGAATVVDQAGQVVPDKYQSFMRSTMRSTAESHGVDTIISDSDTVIIWFRDPKIAEAMVDPSVYIENVIDSGKVLTFTTNEAIKNGYCEGIAENIQEVIDQAGIENYELKEYHADTLEKFIGFLVNPFVHGILIMIIFAGIYFELQTPGIGFPLVAAITAALLYFAPLYLEGLAANWEILIFIVGIILIILEIFVIPGFGVAGISGIVLTIAGLSLSMVDNVVFDFQQPEIALAKISKALMVTCVSLVISFIISIYFSKKMFSSKKLKFALDTTQNTEEGYISIDLKQKTLTGKIGIAATMLRPSGKVEIDEDVYDAVAITAYIEKGEKIQVVRDEAGQVYVKKI